MSDNGSNFLSSNTFELEYLQDDDVVSGYDYNRIVDALTGNRNGLITINSDGLGVIVSPTGISGTNTSGGTTFGLTSGGTSTVAHNDTWVNTENVDPGGFPGRLNFVIPSNALKVIEAVLSFKLLTYRTYNSFTVSNTGAGSAHHHTHGHGLTVSGNAQNPAAVALGLDAGNAYTAANDANTTIHAAGAYGPGTDNDSTNESAHTHSISGSSFIGITEDVKASGVTIQFTNGKTGTLQDATTALNGPWSVDVVEMNILPYLPVDQGYWHTINLTSATFGQIQSHLRLTVLVQANP